MDVSCITAASLHSSFDWVKDGRFIIKSAGSAETDLAWIYQVLKPLQRKKLSQYYCLHGRKQYVISSHNSCTVYVNVLACGQVDVISTQNSCSIVCVNVLACGQVEVSRDTNLNLRNMFTSPSEEVPFPIFIHSCIPSLSFWLRKNGQLNFGAKLARKAGNGPVWMPHI